MDVVTLFFILGTIFSSCLSYSIGSTKDNNKTYDQRIVDLNFRLESLEFGSTSTSIPLSKYDCKELNIRYKDLKQEHDIMRQGYTLLLQEHSNLKADLLQKEKAVYDTEMEAATRNQTFNFDQLQTVLDLQNETAIIKKDIERILSSYQAIRQDATKSIKKLNIEVQDLKTETSLLKKEASGKNGICECPPGRKGLPGDKGQLGIKGLRGEKGQKGETGAIGIKGSRGIIGPQGVEGVPGVKGIDGEPGIKGERGLRGDKGRNGGRGPIGPQGFPGKKGPVGDKGEKGTIGDRGPDGTMGEPGVKGIKGTRGQKGCLDEGSTNVCSDRWLYHRCSCYLFEAKQTRNWHDALTICKENNSTLVKVEDQKENDYIVTQAKKYTSGYMFIGLHDISTDIKKRQFIWTDGSRITFQSWRPNEPNNYKGRKEGCAAFSSSVDSKWNDIRCSLKARYICEKEM